MTCVHKNYSKNRNTDFTFTGDQQRRTHQELASGTKKKQNLRVRTSTYGRGVHTKLHNPKLRAGMNTYNTTSQSNQIYCAQNDACCMFVNENTQPNITLMLEKSYKKVVQTPLTRFEAANVAPVRVRRRTYRVRKIF